MPKLLTELVSEPSEAIDPEFSAVLRIILGDVAEVVAVPVSAKTGVTVPLLDDSVYEPAPFGVMVMVTFAPFRVNVLVCVVADGENERPVMLLIATDESSVNPNLLEALSFPVTTELPKIVN